MPEIYDVLYVTVFTLMFYAVALPLLSMTSAEFDDTLAKRYKITMPLFWFFLMFALVGAGISTIADFLVSSLSFS